MDKLRQVASSGSGVVHYEVENHSHVGEALEMFRKTNAEAIVIIGGQALASAAFEYLIEKNPFEGKLPPLAVLPGGDNNIIAENMGALTESPHRELARLLKRRKAGKMLNNTLSLPLIKVEGAHGVGMVYGLYFCCGGVTGDKRAFNCPIAGNSLFKSLARRLFSIGFIRQASVKALKDKDMQKTVRVVLSERGAVVGRYYMICITTLSMIMMGARLPRLEHEGKIHYLSIENTSDALFSVGKQLLRGRFKGKDLPGQVLREIGHARIVQNGPFVVDGSFFEAEKDGELMISSTARLSFLKL
ncbi:diacylglycerol kinase family protein [Emcibacter sp.]|uniref:diacylglycerol kinase family protein n=1 Tax=Emcibacter sp. TaxID=1979954 RepID=UPI003A8DEF64